MIHIEHGYKYYCVRVVNSLGVLVVPPCMSYNITVVISL